MKNPNTKWNRYLGSKTIRPKTFSVTLERNRNGDYTVVGNGAQMLNVVNQYQADWVPVDARDIAAALRRSNITAA